MTAICMSAAQAPRRTLGKALLRLLLWPARVAQARRDLAMLGSMSDHELSDIGLSRQDLRNATALPPDADPTAAFGALRGCRRQ